ncbi:ubiquitin ligase (cullin) of SCF [Massospora cicadina]|nr:ubiquitin ligase (cullin) of SCF [Massospora cicadina]
MSVRGATKSKDDLDSTWAYLLPRITQLLTTPDAGINPTEYMSVYTYRRQPATDRNVQVDFTGAQLYEKLTKFLADYLTEKFADACKYDYASLLSYYTLSWSKFTLAVKYLHNMFSYLNRHWIKRQNLEDRKVVRDVFTLCIATWKERVFLPNQQLVIQGVLKVVERQRWGRLWTRLRSRLSLIL